MATKLKKILRKKSVKVVLFMSIVVIWVIGGLAILDSVGESNEIFNPRLSTERIALEEKAYTIFEDIKTEIDTGVKSEQLKQSDEFLYYLKFETTSGAKEFSNTDKRTSESFEFLSDYTIIYTDGWSGSQFSFSSPYSLFVKWGVNEPGTIFYFGFTPEYAAKANEESVSRDKEQSAFYENIFKIIYLTSIFSCFPLLLLCIGIGKNKDGEKEVGRLDTIYTEVLVGSFIFIFFVGMTAYMMSLHTILSVTSMYRSEYIVYFVNVGILITIVVTTLGFIFLALVRKIKNRTFFSSSLIAAGNRMLRRMTVSLLKIRNNEYTSQTEKLYNEFQVFILLELVVVGITLFSTGFRSFTFLLGIVLALLMLYFYMVRLKEVLKRIDSESEKNMVDLLKAEQLKVELITNVSHDLKTPLTAIISYIDLLSKEELTETSKEYVEILGEKSHVLKYIVSDLFDIAKATSGSLELSEEQVDIVKLVQQTLAEMTAKIEETGLKLEVEFLTHSSKALVDGAKMYRVLQNVLDNALQYGQTGTRVFVRVENKAGRIITTIKNTANYEMSFTADEIVQRFTRGDESRGTEGSGLGLAIAKSFTEANGGNFHVYIDGDQYKVEIIMPEIVELGD